jgi:acetylornithine deacetylase/succinyl-diaminopimelate desuccinylase-like protein
MSEVIDLLSALVRVPSVSGDELACQDVLEDWLVNAGLTTRRVGRNLLAVKEGRGPGPGLLLCSHVDVVPVGEGWSFDPWCGEVRDGHVLGRGSNDAKSSVAAMAVACATLDAASFDGRLALAFVCDEETGGEGAETLGGELPTLDAVVVGEPTGLDVCPGQRGLLRATLHAEGKACHASRPWEGDNALTTAARDILAVNELALPGADPLLGPATLQATVIAGGDKHNVLPEHARIEIDGRPTPGCDNAHLLALLEEAVASRVELRSNRFLPVRTDDDAPIVQAALAASPSGTLRGFGGLSDLFHFRPLPGLVMGPGTSEASHAADEWVAIEQVEAAVTAYRDTARAFLADPAVHGAHAADAGVLDVQQGGAP